MQFSVPVLLAGIMITGAFYAKMVSATPYSSIATPPNKLHTLKRQSTGLLPRGAPTPPPWTPIQYTQYAYDSSQRSWVVRDFPAATRDVLKEYEERKGMHGLDMLKARVRALMTKDNQLRGPDRPLTLEERAVWDWIVFYQ
ncbi:hypothetical protein BC835DRAFT_1524139 [Cytidiella melzeri]|nr:hypothetical protein BC835DRAFT_1524139 [Cytidiella melzeri]